MDGHCVVSAAAGAGARNDLGMAGRTGPVAPHDLKAGSGTGLAATARDQIGDAGPAETTSAISGDGPGRAGVESGG